MAPGRYCYRCWQDDRIIPDKLHEGFNGFVVSIDFRHLIQIANGDDSMVKDKIRNFFAWPVIEHRDGLVKEYIPLPYPVK